MITKDALKEIVARKKEKLAQAKLALSLEEVKSRIAGVAPARPFMEAISRPRQISLIAEIKKASPSQGVIRQDFSPADIARAYQEAGAQAISVLTEEDYFCGSLDFLQQARNTVSLPLLRKDFIFDPYQVYESRLYGADAVLLIADLLTKDAISEMTAVAAGLGMDCLVEAHTEKELKKLLHMDLPLIGINNRDLHTLELDPKTTERLFILIPKGKVVVIESGIKTSQDVLFLKILGADAVLVGGAFMEASDIGEKVKDLMGW